jgi:hypothetical protein
MARPGIQKYSPLDRFRREEDACADPGIVVQQAHRIFGILRLENDEGATAVSVGAGKNNASLFVEAIHECGVLVPERLLPRRRSRHP